jgi:uncharacterized protein (TIGR02594 family)
MKLPNGYEWIGNVGQLPKMLSEAIALHGTVEKAGAANSPVIMAWAKETGLDHDGYNADSVPWCGLFMAIVAKRAGYAFPKHPLWALNWQGFGKAALQPCLGDVLVFVRPSGGHVGLYVGEDAAAFHVLGGNTHDSVAIARIEKERFRAARSPLFKIGRPASSKPYILAASGKLSRNEA